MTRPTKNSKKRRQESESISFQALEKRILLDGAAVATVADAALSDSIDHEMDVAAAQLAAPNDESAVPGDYDAHVAEFNDYNAPALSLNEIVFIDSSVPDAADFLTHVSATAEVYFIDTSADGVDQVVDILLSLIHI